MKPKRGRPQDPQRNAALAANAIRYQGKPCRKGHSGERYVSTGACVACHGVAVTPDEYANLFD